MEGLIKRLLLHFLVSFWCFDGRKDYQSLADKLTWWAVIMYMDTARVRLNLPSRSTSTFDSAALTWNWSPLSASHAYDNIAITRHVFSERAGTAPPVNLSGALHSFSPHQVSDQSSYVHHLVNETTRSRRASGFNIYKRINFCSRGLTLNPILLNYILIKYRKRIGDSRGKGSIYAGNYFPPLAYTVQKHLKSPL